MATGEILDAVGDGAIDAGLVRCPPARDGLEAHVVRREPQGVLLRRDHALAGARPVALRAAARRPAAPSPARRQPGPLRRGARPLPRGGRRAAACSSAAPTLDLAQTPVVDGRAVAIVGESSRTVIPAALTWVALSPPATLDVALVARAHDRAPALDRLLAAAREAAARLGWLDGHAAPL